MIPPREDEPRLRIERAGRGYRVVGPGVLVWEPTLGEAAERREELEGPWRDAHPPPAPPATGPALPSPASGIYGPVRSRRLGRSLGIDLLPRGARVCSFDCVYCEYGNVSPPGRRAARWPDPGDLASALAAALVRVGPLDSITLSGHGEPTLHPRFNAMVTAILGEARRARADVPVRILTNGCGAVHTRVRRALDLLDERIVKLDASPEAVARPHRRTPLGALLSGVALLRDVTVQACFVEGAVSNTDPASVHAWADLVAELRPRAVQIYTIDRQPADAAIRPAHGEQLEEIACALRARTGIEARVFDSA